MKLLTTKPLIMLRWTLIFLVIAIIAAIFGFGGVAAGAASIAKILFYIFLVLFVLSLIAGGFRRVDWSDYLYNKRCSTEHLFLCFYQKYGHKKTSRPFIHHIHLIRSLRGRLLTLFFSTAIIPFNPKFHHHYFHPHWYGLHFAKVYLPFCYFSVH